MPPLPWSGIEVVITGLTRNQFDGNVRGKRSECQRSALSGEAGNEASLLARNEHRARSKRERRRLSERRNIRILNRRIAPLERSHCLFRMTRSSRFLLCRIAHWATASLAPRRAPTRLKPLPLVLLACFVRVCVIVFINAL